MADLGVVCFFFLPAFLFVPAVLDADSIDCEALLFLTVVERSPWARKVDT